MKLHFLGATRQVTGSRYLLEAAGRKILVDCGMFQEREFLGRNWVTSPIPPEQFDAVLLTHAHIDHSGLLPRLVYKGFSGPIYATHASAGLAEILLRDSATIQEEDAAYKRKRHAKEGRRGRYPEMPLYTDAEVNQTLPLFQPVPYTKPATIFDDITVLFHDAGHILGSAMIEVEVRQPEGSRRVVFSGDIGQADKPFIRDPALLERADYVIMESTYGDRRHEDGDDIDTQLERIIGRTVDRAGNVVIPTFAVERAQELMYHISQLVHANRIADIPIYLDSPMAVDVTELFGRYADSFDRETWELIASRQSPLKFPGLRMARSVEESKAINHIRGPAIIMSTSGMCTAGRIKHHLRHNITRPESTLLFVGFQAHGTLGRQILDGKPRVRIHDRFYDVRAERAQISGLSAHADRPGLLRWLRHFNPAPRHTFLTHGEEDVTLELAQHIRQTMGRPVSVPAYGDTVEI